VSSLDDAAAVPRHELSPDMYFAYHVRATAFNVLTGKMAGKRQVPRAEREAIASAIVDAVEPLIRGDERAITARRREIGKPE